MREEEETFSQVATQPVSGLSMFAWALTNSFKTWLGGKEGGVEEEKESREKVR